MLLFKINSIIDYGSILQENLLLNCDSFDLRKTISEIFDLFKYEFRGKNIKY